MRHPETTAIKNQIPLGERFSPFEIPGEPWVLPNVGTFYFKVQPNTSHLAEGFQNPQIPSVKLEPNDPQKAKKWAEDLIIRLQVPEGDWYQARGVVERAEGDEKPSVKFFWEEPSKEGTEPTPGEFLSIEHYEEPEVGVIIDYDPTVKN